MDTDFHIQQAYELHYAEPEPEVDRSTIRGVVRKRGSTWHYEVFVGPKIVLADNTGSWEPMLQACNFDVAAVRRVIGAGHRLAKSWYDLVEEAQI